jgi:hypothetical protein
LVEYFAVAKWNGDKRFARSSRAHGPYPIIAWTGKKEPRHTGRYAGGCCHSSYVRNAGRVRRDALIKVLESS